MRTDQIPGRASFVTPSKAALDWRIFAEVDAGSAQKMRRTQHDQGFDRSASFAEVAVNLEIDMQRMRLDLRQGGFDTANRAWVSRIECQCCVLDTHVLSLPAGYFGAV